MPVGKSIMCATVPIVDICYFSPINLMLEKIIKWPSI